jgi:hypothetical protein
MVMPFAEISVRTSFVLRGAHAVAPDIIHHHSGRGLEPKAGGIYICTDETVR